jgi:acylphosphatase
MSEDHRLHAVVRGRVQGVGFRHFVMRLAVQLELRGSVCNRPDGTVEVMAWGPRQRLDLLIERLSSGPAGARVSDVEARFDDAPGSASGFEITG